MHCIKILCLIFLVYGSSDAMRTCQPSITTVSGTQAPTGPLCKGQLILDERFVDFDQDLWRHEITLGGGGNGEFQWYVNDRRNSYVRNGMLVLTPTLTKDEIGEDGLESASIDLGSHCTNSLWDGCKRKGTPENIINPIRSARVRTLGSFSFKYGRLEVVAKMPTGDWLWPAIWLLPSDNVYGTWPRSGEIDLLESRGNTNLTNHNNEDLGVDHFGSTLHFGTNWDDNGYSTATYSKNTAPGQGYNKDFHRYQLIWTPEFLRFCIDGHEVGVVNVGDGFYARYPFHGANPWLSGTKAAPFDQQFHILINLAIGGTNGFFPDVEQKPWTNSMRYAGTAFWRGREQWMSTWNMSQKGTTQSSLVVDSVKVWAI